MAKKRKNLTAEDKERMLSELRRDVQRQNAGYRARALKLFPHICASCGREFEGERLKELTVHHKDHNHDNNPSDGSNWELLCIYCHDHEHNKFHDAQYRDGSAAGSKMEASNFSTPFEDLDMDSAQGDPTESEDD